MKEFFAHPLAIVESNQIGPGTRIWAFSHVMQNVVVGRDCNVGEHCFLESGSVIGNNVTIKNANQIWEGVTLEDGVFVGPQAVFTNDLYPRSPRLPCAASRYADHSWLVPTLVERGASIGAGALILAGSTLHEYCLVAAGALVTRDVPAYAVVVGNPARAVGWICRCGARLKFHESVAQCTACGLTFLQQQDGVVPAPSPQSQNLLKATMTGASRGKNCEY